MIHPYRRPANIALVIVNLALAGVLFLQLRDSADDSAAQAAPMVPSVVSAGAPPGTMAARQDRSDRTALVTEIVAKPVFSPARRPDPTAAVTGQPPTMLRLVGVVLSGTRRIALVQVADEPRPRRVAEGEQVGGYRIDGIRSDRIRIRGSDGDRDILLQPITAVNRAPSSAQPQPAASQPVAVPSSND
jgi:type II secretory pathway component PulC